VDVFVGEERVPAVALVGRHADRVAFAEVVGRREEGAGALRQRAHVGRLAHRFEGHATVA